GAFLLHRVQHFRQRGARRRLFVASRATSPAARRQAAPFCCIACNIFGGRAPGGAFLLHRVQHLRRRGAKRRLFVASRATFSAAERQAAPFCCIVCNICGGGTPNGAFLLHRVQHFRRRGAKRRLFVASRATFPAARYQTAPFCCIACNICGGAAPSGAFLLHRVQHLPQRGAKRRLLLYRVQHLPQRGAKRRLLLYRMQHFRRRDARRRLLLHTVQQFLRVNATFL
ncbi:hypothetical protein, partial [Paenibacillus contaminans]|uniref:hypothetical protein n=1 Tax=Paenibacillus contaminans TaxID=450362 RepID=UPI001EDCD47A